MYEAPWTTPAGGDSWARKSLAKRGGAKLKASACLKHSAQTHDSNHAKCAVTGLVRGRGDSPPFAASAIRQLKRRPEQVTINGQPLRVYHPHKEPYKHLGVQLTPTLNWRFHMRELTATFIARLIAGVPNPSSQVLPNVVTVILLEHPTRLAMLGPQVVCPINHHLRCQGMLVRTGVQYLPTRGLHTPKICWAGPLHSACPHCPPM